MNHYHISSTIVKTFLCILLYLFVTSGTVYAQVFTKILAGPAVNDHSQSYGSSFFDFDNDGDVDLYVANFTNSLNRFYENDGNGNFTLLNNSLTTSISGSSLGHSWIDYDLDCDYDLYISNGGVDGSQNNHLFQNTGDSFVQVLTGDVALSNGNSQTSNWGDFDNDGDLDLFVANLGNQNNFLFQNDGGGNFTALTSTPPTISAGESNDANWVDYDGDGDLDLFVANQLNQNNFLFQNNNGTFVQINTGIIVNDGGESYGSVWGDYDNDGDLDLYVCNAVWQANFLYRNDGGGNFTKITSGSIVTDAFNSYGASWIDYDNDGDIDLFVTNIGGQNNCLYRNEGNSIFTRIFSGSIVNDGGHSRSCNWADIDNDGDLDCYVTNRSYSNNFLYRNNIGSLNNWINILLESTISNTNCIGAIVRAKATIYGQPTWQMRHISSKAGYCAQESPNVEFGFGNATMIDSIIVEWPTSNTICYYTNVPTNQHLNYSEDCLNTNHIIQYDTLCSGSNVIIQPGNQIYHWFSDSLGNNIVATDSMVVLDDFVGDTVFYFRDAYSLCSSSIHTLQISSIQPPTINIGTDTTICEGQQIQLSFSGDYIHEWIWSDGTNGTHITTSNDTLYWITASNICGQHTDSIALQFVPFPQFELGNDTTLCDNEPIVLDATQNGSMSYLWQDGSTNPTLTVSQSGEYFVLVDNLGCNHADTIYVSYFESTADLLIPDTTICNTHEFLLDVNTSISGNYFWNNGVTEPSIEIQESGMYIITIQNVCGSFTDSTRITVIDCSTDCEIQIPNVFTPNDDQSNDHWFIQSNCIDRLDCTIINRWGNIVYQYSDKNEIWDGNDNFGTPMTEGVYFYSIHVKLYSGIEKVFHGPITLIRD